MGIIERIVTLTRSHIHSRSFSSSSRFHLLPYPRFALVFHLCWPVRTQSGKGSPVRFENAGIDEVDGRSHVCNLHAVCDPFIFFIHFLHSPLAAFFSSSRFCSAIACGEWVASGDTLTLAFPVPSLPSLFHCLRLRFPFLEAWRGVGTSRVA